MLLKQEEQTAKVDEAATRELAKINSPAVAVALQQQAATTPAPTLIPSIEAASIDSTMKVQGQTEYEADFQSSSGEAQN